MKPLCSELFAGRFGWGRGFVAEGWRVVGFDVVNEPWHRPIPDGCSLALQDVLTLHVSQFREADMIVASPPCQAYSYRAMPWKRAKALPPPDNSLFDTCFRIQREASQAKGAYIPLVVENVKGAQPYVGSARWHYGSFYLWGDVPALMPFTKHSKTVGHANIRDGHSHTRHLTNQRESDAVKQNGLKVPGIDFSGYGQPGYKAKGFNVTAAQRYREGVKQAGLSGPAWFDNGASAHGSRTDSRKAASAMIAEIPLELASHIARVFYPREAREQHMA